MALEDLNLESLSKSKLKPLFQAAMNEVLFSLTEEADVPGDRSITIKLTMKPKEGFVITEMACKSSVPGRTVNTIATLEDHRLKIDTVSGSALQPDLYDQTGGKVVSITDAKQKEGAAS